MRKATFILAFLLLTAPCGAKTITVDDDGPADFNNIQAAINDSNDGDTIEVQPGVYTGDGNRDIDFLGKAITVRSTDPNDSNIVASTIIDCNGTEAEMHRGFYFHSNEDVNSVLDGFTIINGYASGSELQDQDCGGAIHCYDDSNPTIANCVIIGNSADHAGGGIYCAQSSPSVTNCIIAGNFAVLGGGGMCNWSFSSPTLTDCTFSGNVATYDGGAIVNISFGFLTLNDCAFIGNSAGEDGGAISCIDTMGGSINNCVISGNSAGYKGGGLAYFHAPITNCTITGNSASFGGGGGLANCGDPISNCIIWGNSGGQVYPYATDLTPITYSNIQGGWPGLGNIDADPCFADTSSLDANQWDLHLQSAAGRWDPNSESWVIDANTSPCIDAGNPGCPVDSEPMPNGNRINMGAYGGTPTASKSPADWRSIADLTNDWVVDFNDLAVFVDYWLDVGECVPSDLNRSESVNFADYAIFADNQFWE